MYSCRLTQIAAASELTCFGGLPSGTPPLHFGFQADGFDGSPVTYFPVLDWTISGGNAGCVAPGVGGGVFSQATCLLVTPMPGAGTIMGDTFMQAYTIEFDRDRSRIGLAPEKVVD